MLRDVFREVLMEHREVTSPNREVIVDTHRFPVDEVPEGGTLIPGEDDEDVEYVDSLIDDDQED